MSQLQCITRRISYLSKTSKYITIRYNTIFFRSDYGEGGKDQPTVNNNHIANINFGLGVEPEEYLAHYARKLPPLKPVDISVVLNDIYEHQFNIYPHLAINNNNNRPLSSVAFHSCEDINEVYLFHQYVNAYLSNNVYEYFGINLIDFLNLPMDYSKILRQIAETKNKEEKQTNKKNDPFKLF